MQKRTLLVGAALVGALTLSGSAGAVAGGLITSAKIKDGTVRTVDVKNGTLKSIDFKNGTIRRADFNAAVKKDLAHLGIDGIDGATAYEIWLATGNTGTAQEFLDALHGIDGVDGHDGIDGIDGDKGDKGDTGDKGDKGDTGETGANGKDGLNGEHGKDGVNGVDGKDGRDGTDATIASGNWGIIDRNVIGSASAVLRSGPGGAPLGTGSLNLSVADGASKIAFGNEADFAGLKISSINALGFSVYQTGENASISAANLPNISLEVNPGVAGKTYSSLVYNPAPVQPSRWSTVDATQGAGWYFTNAAVAAATGCGQGAGQRFCTLDEIKTAAPDAYVTYSLGIAKGRDSAWHGAVDAVRVNDRVFDFEETGVSAHPAS